MSEQLMDLDHPGAAAHDEASHGAGDRTYVIVAVFLAIMTAAEVATSYAETTFGVFFVWILLIMMAIKFFTVALYFMHLRYDPAMCRRVFFAALALAASVYCIMLAILHFWASGYR